MAVEKQVKKEKGFFSKIDWLDLGVKVVSSAGIAVATGFLGAAGQDIYQSRKVRKLSRMDDSNIKLLDSKRSA